VYAAMGLSYVNDPTCLSGYLDLVYMYPVFA